MDNVNIEKLANSWIEQQKKSEKPNEIQETDPNSWDFDTEYEILLNDPESHWNFILNVLKISQDKQIMEILAAGPLENLLSLHGPRFIDRVEQTAIKNPRFRYLLGGVWQNLMTDEIWERLQKVMGDRW